MTPDLALFDELTTQENLWLATRLSEHDRAGQLVELLELSDLGGWVRRRSRWLARRSALGRWEPAAADQATARTSSDSHQDAERAIQVMQAFRAAADAGAAVLLTSHDPRIVERCHREVRTNTAESSAMGRLEKG